MATDLSPENEQFIRREIQAGVFRSKSDAIDAGIELLRRRKELFARIDEGRRQLDEGDFRDYDEESLANRFSELRERARGSESKRDMP
ncbi:MAG: type II toxin-antitoxin system ParD family antitoxin [Pirellulaceae bacterium]